MLHSSECTVQILFVEERESTTSESGRCCSTGLEIHLAQIYKEVAKDRILEVPVQQQTGLWCLQYCQCFQCCNWKKRGHITTRTTRTYNDKKMREHLQLWRARPFPETSIESVQRCEARQITIYCVCALPKTYDNHMVQCDTCDELWPLKLSPKDHGFVSTADRLIRSNSVFKIMIYSCTWYLTTVILTIGFSYNNCCLCINHLFTYFIIVFMLLINFSYCCFSVFISTIIMSVTACLAPPPAQLVDL